MAGLPLNRILFVQKPEVMEEQRQGVADQIRSVFPSAEVICADSPEAIEPVTTIDALIAPTLPWLPEVLQRVTGLAWIHFLSAGVERIWDMPFDKSAYVLTKSSGVHAAPMSEYAIGAMLHFAKKFDQLADQAARGVWQRAWLDELTGRSLIILGMGHIGTELAKRARVFGMDVCGVARNPDHHAGDLPCIGLKDLAAQLERTDYLVVCLPLTAQTAGLVDEALLGHIKRGSVLVDMSRGGIVLESAVISALDCGRLRGVALDVFEQEPLPASSPLWKRPEVLLTPHVAGTTPLYMTRAIDIFLDNARALTTGGAAVTPVDIEKGY